MTHPAEPTTSAGIRGAGSDIYLWVRATVDWADERAFRAQLNPTFAPMVELWDDTFTLPFHRFRQRVREIAQHNHRRVEAVRVDDWEQIPAGALVLPTDDDDWFAPDAARVLAASAVADATGYRWPSRWVEVPTSRLHAFYLFRRRLFPWLPPKYVCTTNNYAMVKRDWTGALLRNHCRASDWFDGRSAPEVIVIARALSVANRTLASQTTLGVPFRTIGRRELRRKFRRYRRLYAGEIAPALAWARPYVAMMAELIAELELRRGD